MNVRAWRRATKADIACWNKVFNGYLRQAKGQMKIMGMIRNQLTRVELANKAANILTTMVECGSAIFCVSFKF